MSDRRIITIFAICAAAFLLLMSLAAWYAAGVQAQVYRRQGIDMSQWEVFIGAKPAERTINLKAPLRRTTSESDNE